MKTAHIGIGNSDDKLDQARWSLFIKHVESLCKYYCQVYIGEWFSAPHQPWQNAQFAIEIEKDDVKGLKKALADLAQEFNQDSIALCIGTTEFIG